MRNDLTTIRLYGKLGARFGRVHRLSVASPAEAVRALCAMLPGFEAFLYEAKDKFKLGFAVFVGKDNLVKDQLTLPHGNADIRIAPMAFGGKAGIVNIIVGAVLIVVGCIALYFGQPWGMSLIYAGAAMMVGGIIQMLAPQPKDQSQDDSDKRTSYSFNGAVNTQAQGNPVPYFGGGPLRIGSAVISASIEAKDQVYIPVGGYGAAGGGAGAFWGHIIQVMQADN